MVTRIFGLALVFIVIAPTAAIAEEEDDCRDEFPEPLIEPSLVQLAFDPPKDDDAPSENVPGGASRFSASIPSLISISSIL